MTARMIKQHHIDVAFDWLVENSGPVGIARAELSRKEYLLKKAFSQEVLDASGSVEVKKAKAYVSERYKKAHEEMTQAEAAWESLRDHRNKCELIIEAWRSEEASRRFVDKITS